MEFNLHNLSLFLLIPASGVSFASRTRERDGREYERVEGKRKIKFSSRATGGFQCFKIIRKSDKRLNMHE